MPPAMGLPSMSRRRSAIWLGVPEAARVWLTPEMGWSRAYSGRAPIGGEGDALAGSVEAGVDADDLALGERADGERLGGDAGGVGDCCERNPVADAAAGWSLPGDGLAGEGNAVRERQEPGRSR